MAELVGKSFNFAKTLGGIALVIATIGSLSSAGSSYAGPCVFYPQESGLVTREGYTDFMSPERFKPFRDALPKVADTEVQSALSSLDTMWYDEQSMVFLYQDSVETVVGGRANCVGRKTGERNQGTPIAKLMNYFGSDYRFMFPFRKAAGTDNVTNLAVIDFWVPARAGGKVLPVKWWKRSARGRWHWVFPVGTLFGEILFQKSPNGKWYPFEVRTRKRYSEGWSVNLFRPFQTATALASAVVSRRPAWQNSASLSGFVNHLRNPSTLVPKKLSSTAFAKIFPSIEGHLDLLPDVDDKALISELLSETTFVSVEGQIWKEGGGKETYAPSSVAEFSIVPKGYELGVIPVNEVSCNRCHQDTGHPIGHMETDVMLYGEVWGEDRIFTWHLFESNRNIFDTFDDVDVSRKINSRLVAAGLVKNEKPAANDPVWRQLPVNYKPIE